MGIFFLIRSLERGGAERQLIELVAGLDKEQFSVTVATFYDTGELGEELDRIDGVRRISLHKRGRWDLVMILWRLWVAVRQAQPQIIHGYLDVANLCGLLMGRLVGAKVVWGVRASNVDLSQYDWLARVAFRLECLLAGWADLIIVNSQAGWDYHLANGFPQQTMVAIPNGISTERFRPDREAGQKVRAEWNVSVDERLIGLVGRLDPMKDHATFLKAAAHLLESRIDVRFVCVGNGPQRLFQQMRALSESLGLDQHVIWAGARDDMRAVYNALDLATSSSSFGEGFSNVIGEAMACGVPCVVTNVGDSRLIVGDTGFVVVPRDPQALADGWNIMLARIDRHRQALAEAARRRIINDYSRAAVVQRTSSSLIQLLASDKKK
ncbi:MAG: glycosyltransferase [Acidobacteria bacterium]|nr:glycosyltransferase [Acidobacteriota bacterium]MBI3656813.1 glycosyltransferase [Acidobacteriota bacterium]